MSIKSAVKHLFCINFLQQNTIVMLSEKIQKGIYIDATIWYL